jgi:hypothetical protein
MAEWHNGGMAEWAEWQNDGMAEWRNGGMAEWRNGGMTKWQNGKMAKWHNVRYEIVWNQDTESTQMPPWQSPSRLVFINKDKPMLLLSSKRLVPQSWNTLNGMFQTKRKVEIELNFFEYSNSKRYLVVPDIVEYNQNNKPQYALILGVKTMKKYGII